MSIDQLPPTNIEKTHDFEHQAFRRYMYLGFTGKSSPNKLAELGLNMMKGSRSDLVAISPSRYHGSTRLQVSSELEQPQDKLDAKAMVYIDARREMALEPQGNLADTLRALILREESGGADTAVTNRLDGLSNNLLRRLVAYEFARDQHTLASQQKRASLRRKAVDVAGEQ